MVRRSALMAAVLGSCSAVALADSHPVVSLYERLGGESGVTAIVSDAINAAAADSDARASLNGSPDAQKRRLAAHICALSGGNCPTQDAPELRDVSRLLEPLRVSMRSHDVPLAVRNELLDVLSAGREPARR